MAPIERRRCEQSQRRAVPRLYSTLSRTVEPLVAERRRHRAHLRLRPDGLRADPRRQRPAVRRVLGTQALSDPARLRGALRLQRDRHQRQDLRRRHAARACPRPSWPSAVPAPSTSPTPTASGWAGPTLEPTVTGHMPEIIALIERLIDAGLAYPSERRRLLPRRPFPGLRQAVGAPPGRDARRPSRGRPRSTPSTSPSGRGTSPTRTPPGSRRGGRGVRAGTSSARRWPRRALGPSFEIHGGGIDLVFPHHENEIAQSEGATRRADGPDLGAQRDARAGRRRCPRARATSCCCATRSTAGAAMC